MKLEFLPTHKSKYTYYRYDMNIYRVPKGRSPEDCDAELYWYSDKTWGRCERTHWSSRHIVGEAAALSVINLNEGLDR